MGGTPGGVMRCSAADPAFLLGPVPLADLLSLDLSGARLRQLGYELHRPGALVAGDLTKADSVDVLGRHLEPRPHHDDGANRLTPLRVGHPHDGDLRHSLDRGDGVLDLGREDVEAARDDHVLLAIDDVEEALLHPAYVSCGGPAAGK